MAMEEEQRKYGTTLTEANVMPAKEEITQDQNGNGLRDYSHLPRAKDLPKVKNPTPEQMELRKATKEFLQALDEEVKKYGTTFN